LNLGLKLEDCRPNLAFDSISLRRFFADLLANRDAEAAGWPLIAAQNPQQHMTMPKPFTVLINSLEILPML